MSSLFNGALLFFIGVSLVAFGSAYYHYIPNNLTLVWDRIPMTIAFMALYSLVVSAFVKQESGVKLLPWLISAGVLSVIYWWLTESIGRGDLRFYALVQFLPLLLMIFIMMLFSAEGVKKWPLTAMFIWYALAKILEAFDQEVFNSLTLISGHTLKHLVSAIGGLFVLFWLWKICCYKEQQSIQKTGSTC